MSEKYLAYADSYTVFKPCVREIHISEICVQEIHIRQGIGIILFSTEYRQTVKKCVPIVLPRIPKSVSYMQAANFCPIHFKQFMWILRGLVYTDIMMHGFQDTWFSPGSKNRVSQGLTVEVL